MSISQGADAVRLMNAAGYDLAALGNHEFDYGLEQMERNLDAAAFPVVCANVLRADGTLLFRPNWLYENAGGLTIGFFGLDTPESKTKANPIITAGLTFLEGEALADCARAQTASLRAEGADLVIALTHLGIDPESAPSRSEDVYAAVPEIDFIIDGHSHTVMTAGERGEPIQSTGAQFANIGVIVIDNASRTIEDHFLLPAENLEQDPSVAALAAEIHAAVDAAFGQVIGESLVELEGDRAFNRVQETNHGDLIADAQLWYVSQRPEALHVAPDHLVSVINGGTIREYLHVGEITRRDVNTVLPFGNTLCVVYVTGAELLEALEASAFRTPEQVGGYPQTAGLKWTIDTTKPYDKGERYPDSTYCAPASIRRVSIESVNGQPFSLTDTYAVATSNFTAAGGDTYHVFGGNERFDTGMLMDELVVAYIREALGGVVDERYAAADGRETRITLENSVCLPSPQTLTVQDETVSAEVYNINGENYFKLRDVAMLLSGTAVQFSVDYDAERNTVSLETGKAYAPVGGELVGGADRSGALAVSAQTLLIDGTERSLCAFNLAGNNFFRIVDLGEALGFAADYDADSDTVAILAA
jgi:5'-nucleotidase